MDTAEKERGRSKRTALSVGPASLGVRPEHFSLAPPDTSGLPGAVHFLEPVGSDLFIAVDVGDTSVQVRLAPYSQVSHGDNIRLVFDPSVAHLFGSGDRNLREPID